MTRSKKEARKNSFKSREAGRYKVRKILDDIEEARSMGIKLHTISLNELNNYLRHARKQKAEFEQHLHGKFVYDPMEHQQFPHDTDGLDDLAAKTMRSKKKVKKVSKSRKNSRSKHR